MNPSIQRRIIRAASIIGRVEEWFRLAFLDEEEVDSILRDRNQESDDAEAACDSTGTGVYPAGPRNDKNKSRYQLSPGHSQNLSDLLRHTAEAKAVRSLDKLLDD